VSQTAVQETHAERTGLEDLFVRYSPGAVRLAYLMTGDPDLAQDISQEAFVRVAGRFRHLRWPDAFDAYLRKTVVNLCTSHFRHEKVHRDFIRREAPRTELTSEVPDIAIRDELRQALRLLPVRQRAAVVFRYYEDLSEEQMAGALNCSVPAARSLLSRGMKTLRETIEGEER